MPKERLLWGHNLWAGEGGCAALVAQETKNLPAMQKTLHSIPGVGRSPGEGNTNPLHNSCLKNSMDRGAWWATVHGGHKESDTTDLGR